MIDQSDAVCVGCVDHIAAHHEFEGTAFAYELSKSLGTAVSGDQTEVHFRLPESGVFTGQSNVTTHRQFTATAQGKSVYGCDDRFGTPLDAEEAILPAFGQSHRLFVAQFGEFADVGTGNKCLGTSTGENHTADGRIGFDLIH